MIRTKRERLHRESPEFRAFANTYVVRDVGVAGSNPATPTSEINGLPEADVFFPRYPHSLRTVSVSVRRFLLKLRVVVQVCPLELVGGYTVTRNIRWQ